MWRSAVISYAYLASVKESTIFIPQEDTNTNTQYIEGHPLISYR